MDVGPQSDIEVLADTPGRTDHANRPPRGRQELRGSGGVHVALVVDDQDAVARDIRARDDINRVENRQRRVVSGCRLRSARPRSRGDDDAIRMQRLDEVSVNGAQAAKSMSWRTGAPDFKAAKPWLISPSRMRPEIR